MKDKLDAISRILDELETVRPADEPSFRESFQLFELPEVVASVVDYLQPMLRPYEVAIYWYMFRHSIVATGAKAVMSRAVGAKFMAHAGHLRGRNLAIVSKRLIVQSWRGSNWKKRDLDSILVLVFSRVRGGGRISLVQVNVPDAHASSINRGWLQYYWKPWKAHLRRKSRAH